MLSCFPRIFARLANMGSVAKAKQSLKNNDLSISQFKTYPRLILGFIFDSRLFLHSKGIDQRGPHYWLSLGRGGTWLL